MFKPSFSVGDVVSNEQIVEEFKCGNMGGMRRSKTSNTLVLITDHTKGLYEDHWDGDVLYYTGMGKSGDQSLEFMQNTTLADSKQTMIPVHLFEVIVPRQYVYRGRVELVEEPYQAQQKGEDGEERNVWIFPLRLIENDAQISTEELVLLQQSLDKKAKKLSLDELRQYAHKQQQTKPALRIVNQSQAYIRDPVIARYAKERAKGRCQLCSHLAPFEDAKGDAYLENHHIDWLSQGGSDTIENTVALCPNCHRKMHILKQPSDIATLKEKAKDNK